MKNDFDVQGDVTIVFLKNRGEIFRAEIDTRDLEKVASIKTSWRIQRKNKLYVVAELGTERKFRVINFLGERNVIN